MNHNDFTSNLSTNAKRVLLVYRFCRCAERHRHSLGRKGSAVYDFVLLTTFKTCWIDECCLTRRGCLLSATLRFRCCVTYFECRNPVTSVAMKKDLLSVTTVLRDSGWRVFQCCMTYSGEFLRCMYEHYAFLWECSENKL